MDLCYDVELCNLVYGYAKMDIIWIFKDIMYVNQGVLIWMLKLQVLQQSLDKDHTDGHDIPLTIINVVLFMCNIFNVICYMITDLQRYQMDQLILEMNAQIYFYRYLYLIVYLYVYIVIL